MALAEVFESFVGPDAPLEFTAYDGSHVGQPGSPVKITVRSPVAVAYLAQAPGELGLARAYVAGHLDIEGDMYEALSRLTRVQAEGLGVGPQKALDERRSRQQAPLFVLERPQVLGPDLGLRLDLGHVDPRAHTRLA